MGFSTIYTTKDFHSLYIVKAPTLPRKPFCMPFSAHTSKLFSHGPWSLRLTPVHRFPCSVSNAVLPIRRFVQKNPRPDRSQNGDHNPRYTELLVRTSSAVRDVQPTGQHQRIQLRCSSANQPMECRQSEGA